MDDTRPGKKARHTNEAAVLNSDGDRGGDTSQVIGEDGAIFYAGAADDDDDSGSNAPWRSFWGFMDFDEQDEAAAEQLRRETEYVNNLQATDNCEARLDFGDIESTYKSLLSFDSAQTQERVSDLQQEPGVSMAAVEIDHASPASDTGSRSEEGSLVAEVDELDGEFDSETPSDAEKRPRIRSQVVQGPKKTPRRRLQRGRKPKRAESEGEESEMFCRKEYVVGGYIVEEMVRKTHPSKTKTGKKNTS